jgi:hypothetical protein
VILSKKSSYEQGSDFELMFVWTFLLRITHTIISQTIADSSWITIISVTVQNQIHVHMNFFCLESHILSFPKVLQIPPESPRIYTLMFITGFVTVSNFVIDGHILSNIDFLTCLSNLFARELIIFGIDCACDLLWCNIQQISANQEFASRPPILIRIQGSILCVIYMHNPRHCQ